MSAHTISDLHEGDSVLRTFGVREAALSTDRNGSPFLRLTLCDRTGEITARKWHATEAEWEALREARFVTARGTVETYRGQLQVILAAVTPAQAPDRLDDYLPATRGDRRAHRALLKEMVDSLREPYLRALMLRLFSDKEFRALYYAAPGAERMHHACVGGLLEHSLEVAALALSVCEKVPHLRRDLVLVGALLHDVGKTEETQTDAVAFLPSMEGGLVGHIVLGVSLVDRAIAGIPGFPPSLRAAVLHLLVSHHGSREWGAPVAPAFAEAFVLHYCDQISTKLALCREGAEGAATGLFARAKGLDGRLYVGDIDYAEAGRALADGEVERVFGEEELEGRPVLRIVAGGLAGSLEGSEPLPDLVALPIVGHIAAGTPIDAEEHVEGYRAVPLLSITGVKDFLLRVTGDSMRNAHILDGDLVRVRPPVGEPREGDIVAALVNGEVTVKRFHRAAGGILLRAENPDYPDIPVGASDDFAVQGTVVGLLRERIL